VYFVCNTLPKRLIIQSLPIMTTIPAHQTPEYKTIRNHHDEWLRFMVSIRDVGIAGEARLTKDHFYITLGLLPRGGGGCHPDAGLEPLGLGV